MATRRWSDQVHMFRCRIEGERARLDQKVHLASAMICRGREKETSKPENGREAVTLGRA